MSEGIWINPKARNPVAVRKCKQCREHNRLCPACAGVY